MTVLLREAIGDRLRHARTTQSRTLREVSKAARVSLGYLSEVERGRKEASSELLAAICDALALPIPDLLQLVATDLGAMASVPEVPDAAVAEPAAGGAPAARMLGGGRMVSAFGEELADFRVQPQLSHRITVPIPPAGPQLDVDHGVVVAA
jgi:transcriptional regulator with XRE-family HTH domain